LPYFFYLKNQHMNQHPQIPEILRDRIHGAQLLSEFVIRFRNTNSIVIAIPMGGIPVGYHLAKLLNLPMEISFCKKIANPSGDPHPIGSISDDCVILNEALHEIPGDYLFHKINSLRNIMRQRDKLLCDTKHQSIKGKTAIIVDDRLKNIETILASVRSIKKQQPASIIVAVPVASKTALNQLAKEVDEIVCPIILNDEKFVGEYYENLPRVTEQEAQELLRRNEAGAGHHHAISLSL
jgi:putative phosphoribosyl transferase